MGPWVLTEGAPCPPGSRRRTADNNRGCSRQCSPLQLSSGDMHKLPETWRGSVICIAAANQTHICQTTRPVLLHAASHYLWLYCLKLRWHFRDLFLGHFPHWLSLVVCICFLSILLIHIRVKALCITLWLFYGKCSTKK